jgi:hypothetical protein
MFETKDGERTRSVGIKIFDPASISRTARS